MIRLRITAGMGTIDDYESYARAGADELFCGYVPAEWVRRFGSRAPLNRREVLSANVQLGAMTELLILRDMIGDIGVPVALTFNHPIYTPEQIDYLTDLALQLSELGFTRYIVSDLRLIRALRQIPGLQLHASGEHAVMNRLTARLLEKEGISRIIFPRQTGIDEMAEVIRRVPEPVYEAFALNERCHFTGAYCMTLHRDGMPPICRVPYRLPGFEPRETEPDPELPGAGGCALCALWRLREAGVRVLKLVSRGNTTERTLADIRLLRSTIGLLEDAATEGEYRSRLRKEKLSEGCVGNCYYY